ncbi:MAG: hypothetical protein ACK4RK_12565 [Gemmataceae bacterium]
MAATLLMSTFTALLRVTIDDQHQLAAVEPLHTGMGIYFGLTAGQGHVFAVARNLDIHKQVLDARWGRNNILVSPYPFDPTSWQAWTLPEFADLHQIRFHGGLLWIVNGRAPELLAVDPRSRRLVVQLPLADMVPAEWQHPAPPEHPEDRFHFNSLFFTEDRLFVLAHNWDEGSFVLELSHAGPETALAMPRVARMYPHLGRNSHDVYWDGERLLVLDSGGCRVLTSDGQAGVFGSTETRGGFLRGLAVDDRFLYVGQGSFSDARADRMNGASWLVILERPTLRPLAMLDVGPFGNTCDLLLLDPPPAT